MINRLDSELRPVASQQRRRPEERMRRSASGKRIRPCRPWSFQPCAERGARSPAAPAGCRRGKQAGADLE